MSYPLIKEKKKIVTTCPLCKNKEVVIEVHKDLGKYQDYYPFEYAHVHGDPPHVLMLYLDKSLNIRAQIACKYVNVANSPQKELLYLAYMSENETLASIYLEPLRLHILNILTEGPIVENLIIKLLSEEADFNIHEFTALILPFFKAGLIKTSWCTKKQDQCYYLIKDFMALKISSEKTLEAMEYETKFRTISKEYLAKHDAIFSSYIKKFFSDQTTRIKEIQECLKILQNEQYERIINKLRQGPIKLEKLLGIGLEEQLKDLIEKEIIFEFNIEEIHYLCLLCDIIIKKFTPEYLISKIPQKLENKEITFKMAKRHLEFLFEAEK